MILTQRTENIDHITECKDEEFEKKYKFIIWPESVFKNDTIKGIFKAGSIRFIGWVWFSYQVDRHQLYITYFRFYMCII